ncbi:signal peptidase I [Georgenia satyanarayanai]|uniref:signal peptidase I n=1 Tax=Georgenia satyanarayanai TaxID=860221 RepID=UPI00203E1304|nr:signal peptidase I [Georgenia satyanarayanai]MCM3660800.1 signal peptidase I [Georgenia satyanarayanai]
MATTVAAPDTTPAPAEAPTGTFWRAVLSGTTAVLLVALLLLAAAVAVVPRVLGGAALTVLTGSMEPTYSPGDMVVSVPQDRYEVGDVVTFQPVAGDPTLITHRVVGLTLGAETAYITRGDANGADDDPVSAEQVMGRVVYHVPYVGHLAGAVGPNRGVVVTAVACLLIGYGSYLVIADSRAGRRRGPGQITPGES